MVGSVNGRGNGYVVPNVKQPPSSFYGQQSPLFSANNDSYNAQQHENKSAGEKIGTLLSGLADAPGRLIGSIADIVTDPKKLLTTAATIGVCFIPGIGPIAASALLAYGLGASAMGIAEGASQIKAGWQNDNLDQIRDGAAGAGASAIGAGLTVAGVRAKIRADFTKGGAAKDLMLKDGVVSSGKKVIESADDITALDSVRLFARQGQNGVKAGFGTAKEAAGSEWQTFKDVKNAEGYGAYASGLKGRTTSAVGKVDQAGIKAKASKTFEETKANAKAVSDEGAFRARLTADKDWRELNTELKNAEKALAKAKRTGTTDTAAADEANAWRQMMREREIQVRQEFAQRQTTAQGLQESIQELSKKLQEAKKSGNAEDIALYHDEIKSLQQTLTDQKAINPFNRAYRTAQVYNEQYPGVLPAIAGYNAASNPFREEEQG
ncbi:MAG TPA: hypothetical protein V6C52_01890 [Coleofasciculaceae cyanobacterium]|jgi:hypothetical protein